MQLDVTDISKRYGQSLPVLDGVSFSVPGGSICGIVGENGAGKSTLAQIVAGTVAPDAGNVVLQMGSRSYISQRARSVVGVVPQAPSFVAEYDAVDNVFFGTEPASWPGLAVDTVRQADLAALFQEEWFPLPPGRPPQWSGRQRARVAIVRGLGAGRPVLVVDEATSGLEQADRGALFRALRRYADKGRIVIVVSHRFSEIVEHCDLAYAVVRGKAWPVAPISEERLLEIVFGSPAAPLPRLGNCYGATILRVTCGAATVSVRSGEVVAIVNDDSAALEPLYKHLRGGERGPFTSVVGDVSTTGSSTEGRRTMGMAFVPPKRLVDGLVPDLSCEDNLMLNPFIARGAKQAMRRETAVRLMRDVGIPKSPDTLVRELSGGNQQKLTVIKEVGGLPERGGCLVAFNPCSGVDASARRTVLECIRQAASTGCAVLLLSTEPEDVLAVADVAVRFRVGEPVVLNAPFESATMAGLFAPAD